MSALISSIELITVDQQHRALSSGAGRTNGELTGVKSEGNAHNNLAVNMEPTSNGKWPLPFLL